MNRDKEAPQPYKGEMLTPDTNLFFGNLNNADNKLIKPWLTETIRAMEVAIPSNVHEIRHQPNPQEKAAADILGFGVVATWREELAA